MLSDLLTCPQCKATTDVEMFQTWNYFQRKSRDQFRPIKLIAFTLFRGPFGGLGSIATDFVKDYWNNQKQFQCHNCKIELTASPQSENQLYRYTTCRVTRNIKSVHAEGRQFVLADDTEVWVPALGFKDSFRYWFRTHPPTMEIIPFPDRRVYYHIILEGNLHEAIIYQNLG